MIFANLFKRFILFVRKTVKNVKTNYVLTTLIKTICETKRKEYLKHKVKKNIGKEIERIYKKTKKKFS